jgi:NAD-dependent dihydropyrimidine dehydrogenase PreA subunit
MIRPDDPGDRATPAWWEGKRISGMGRPAPRGRHIGIDTGKCRACWKCIGECPGGVLGRIDLPFHKHVRLRRGGECRGCMKCLKACEHGAIYELSPAGVVNHERDRV